MARRIVPLASAALLIVLVAAPAASATRPDKYNYEFDEEWYLGSCEGFDIIQADHARVAETWHYNRDGTVNRIHFHMDFEGMVYNSTDPTKWLPGAGHVNADTDESFEVWTEPGLSYKVKLPGGGVVIDAGLFVVDLRSGEPVFDLHAGNHQILGGDIGELCAALS
jgi:hypothetical protein